MKKILLHLVLLFSLNSYSQSINSFNFTAVDDSICGNTKLYFVNGNYNLNNPVTNKLTYEFTYTFSALTTNFETYDIYPQYQSKNGNTWQTQSNNYPNPATPQFQNLNKAWSRLINLNNYPNIETSQPSRYRIRGPLAAGTYTFRFEIRDVADSIDSGKIRIKFNYTDNFNIINTWYSNILSSGDQGLRLIHIPSPRFTFNQSTNTLTAAANLPNWQWMLNGNPILGATYQNLYLNYTGYIRLKTFYPSGCTTLSTDSFYWNATSIQHINDYDGIIKYFNKELSITQMHGISSVNVYDVTGREIYKFQMKNDSKEFLNLESGIYVINVFNKDQQERIKIYIP